MDLQHHATIRVRHELRRRMLTVSSAEHLTPRMRRFGFTSPDLRDFVSAAHDDHIKLFFPGNDAGERKTCMRDFTPRRFDRDRGTLFVDFALHDAGPATQWAASARIGDRLEIGGPKGSIVGPDDFDWYLLIGDETALPAIGRRVEELRANVPVATFVVTDAGETQHFHTRAAWTRIGSPETRHRTTRRCSARRWPNMFCRKAKALCGLQPRRLLRARCEASSSTNAGTPGNGPRLRVTGSADRPKPMRRSRTENRGLNGAD